MEQETEALKTIIREIQERVRAAHPSGPVPDASILLPDLMPLVHARDGAQAKVAAIGSVNPRRPGALNSVVQAVKKTVARLLDWHVREQVEFNRAVVASLNTIIETLDANNRALAEVAAARAVRKELEEAGRELREQLQDIRVHGSEWRQSWEAKLTETEVRFLRAVADLQAAFQHRAATLEADFRDLASTQHQDFQAQHEKAAAEMQKLMWSELAKSRAEFEQLIHTELRLLRQRVSLDRPEARPVAAASSAPPEIHFDYGRFAERFRGTEEYVKGKQSIYLPYFDGCREVLDIGCGRGEFLELMKTAGVPARGIDLSAESIAICRAKGLAAETADLFPYLAGLPDASLDGIFCAQVVEHLPPARVAEMVGLAWTKLAPDGLLLIETPNPECLAIFATHFYLDPTHTRPIPPALLDFYLGEAGFGRIEVLRLAPAADSMPSLSALPEEFRAAFFGDLDYAITGHVFRGRVG